MPSHVPDHPGALEALVFLRRRLYAVLLMLTMAIGRRMHGVDNGEPFLKTAAVALLTCSRKAFPGELYRRRLTPTTGETIKSYCRSKGIPYRTILLDDEPAAVLHIVGHDKKKLIYYLHGGGYVQPIFGPGHISFTLECAKAADAQIAFLEYTLAPELQYPGQLIQAVHGLIALLKDHPPSSLILGGDSAGGNLCLAVLAHTSKPSPYAPQVNMQGEKFRAIYLTSPWVGLDYTADSYKRNNDYDFITREPQMLNVTKYWNPKYEDIYANQLSQGSPSFWSTTVSSLVQNMLITAGTREIFYDDIVAFSKKVGAVEEKGARVELARCEKEVHTSCILDSAIKAKVVGMRAAILEFLARWN